ncbi:phospholipase A2 [Streptomyces sp. NPDC101393]|uniref:phospholipase A2 n=1 Tax=Streptomyces sp. NPDC101393 TaxID=3366141 RepID=UPI00382B5E9D
MRISRATFASVAGAGIITVAAAAPALASSLAGGTAPDRAPSVRSTQAVQATQAAHAADHGRTAVAGPSKKAKLKRLYPMTRSSSRSAGDWRLLRAQQKSGNNPYGFIWTTDYCTRLADKPGGFNFKLSCARHDFGYRNDKALIGKTAFKGSTHERRIDKAFLFDMKQQCHTQSGKTEKQRAKCLKTAKAYYERVS